MVDCNQSINVMELVSTKIEGPQQIIMAVQMSSAAMNETGGAKKRLESTQQ